MDSGVNGEGLMTTVQPTRIAGITCQVAMSSGQFQGVMEPTTPTGLRRQDDAARSCRPESLLRAATGMR